MGVLIDTAVFIRWERERRQVDFGRWSSYGNAGVSVITASELLIGVRRANSEERRLRREAFVEGILSRLPVIEINLGIARVHAEILVDLAIKGSLIGTHDLWIAATARYCDYAVLTTNTSEFKRVSGLMVLGIDAET